MKRKKEEEPENGCVKGVFSVNVQFSFDFLSKADLFNIGKGYSFRFDLS